MDYLVLLIHHHCTAAGSSPLHTAHAMYETPTTHGCLQSRRLPSANPVLPDGGPDRGGAHNGQRYPSASIRYSSPLRISHRRIAFAAPQIRRGRVRLWCRIRPSWPIWRCFAAPLTRCCMIRCGSPKSSGATPSLSQELVFQTALAVGMLIVNGDSSVREILR